MLLRRLARLLLVSLLLPLPSLLAKTPPSDHWVGTWASAPMGQPNPASSSPLQPDHTTFFAQDTTLREIVHLSLGGPLLRVVLSNEFGTEPLHIGAVHIAPSAGSSSISLFSANALTFGGQPDVTIPAGALVVSDPAGLATKPFADLAVSLFIPAQHISTLTLHENANQTSYMATGNLVGEASLPSAQVIHTWPILKGIDVRISGLDGAVVCFGDSITDGWRSTENANTRWPNVLADRLAKHHLAVLDEGIGGNRILLDRAGPNALARFDRDVLAQAGVRYLIVLEGINDIGSGYRTENPSAHPPSAQDLIRAFQQMIIRAHTHNIAVFGATITPYFGAGYASPAGEQVREAVNTWIRTSNAFDGIIDFDAATRDKINPQSLSPAADSGDHLHPSDSGYKIMGDSINLGLFAPPKKKSIPPRAKIAPPDQTGSATAQP